MSPVPLEPAFPRLSPQPVDADKSRIKAKPGKVNLRKTKRKTRPSAKASHEGHRPWNGKKTQPRMTRNHFTGAYFAYLAYLAV
jgi:hypothetical protein